MCTATIWWSAFSYTRNFGSWEVSIGSCLGFTKFSGQLSLEWLKRADVVQKLEGVAPGPIREHAIEISGVRFPIKQAFACATGMDVLDFTTDQARRVFKHLGFKVTRVA